MDDGPLEVPRLPKDSLFSDRRYILASTRSDSRSLGGGPTMIGDQKGRRVEMKPTLSGFGKHPLIHPRTDSTFASRWDSGK